MPCFTHVFFVFSHIFGVFTCVFDTNIKSASEKRKNKILNSRKIKNASPTREYFLIYNTNYYNKMRAICVWFLRLGTLIKTQTQRIV